MSKIRRKKPASKKRSLFWIALFVLSGLTIFLFWSEFRSVIGVAPRPEVVSYDASSRLDGLDYMVIISGQVKNNGKDGKVVVFAELENGSYWKKEQTVYIRRDHTMILQFNFPEAELLEQELDAYDYKVWAKAK